MSTATLPPAALSPSPRLDHTYDAGGWLMHSATHVTSRGGEAVVRRPARRIHSGGELRALPELAPDLSLITASHPGRCAARRLAAWATALDVPMMPAPTYVSRQLSFRVHITPRMEVRR